MSGYKDDFESRPTGLCGAGRTATATAKRSNGTSPITKGMDTPIIRGSPILGRSGDPMFCRPPHPANGLVCRTGRMNSETEYTATKVPTKIRRPEANMGHPFRA